MLAAQPLHIRTHLIYFVNSYFHNLLKLWVLTRFFVFPQAGDDMPDPVAVFLFLFFICLTWRKVN